VARREKKSIEVINGNPVEMAGFFDFAEAFSEWKRNCRKYKTSQISPKPPQGEGGVKNPKTKSIPVDLLEQVRNHVSGAVARANSPNKGSTGIYTALNEIEGKIVEKKIFTELDKEVLEKFITLLNSFLTHPSLNPQNIVFKRPDKYRMVKNKLKVLGNEKTEIYGHYIDDYFLKRYPKFKPPAGYESWSSKQKNTATPPLYQAIYGGDMFSNGGLIEILEEGLEKIKTPINPTIRNVSSDTLAQVPQVKSWVIKNSKKFYKGGKYQISAFRNALNSQVFSGSENNTFKRLITAAITGQKLSSIKRNVLAHPIPEFRIDLRTDNAMRNLIKNSYIRSPRAKAPDKKEKTEEVKKWFEMVL